VKTVNFDVCEKAPKLSGYHKQGLFNYCKNYLGFVIRIHKPTNAEKLMKFGPVFAEIFGMICRFLPSRPKRYRNSLHNLWDLWTDLHQNCIRCK